MDINILKKPIITEKSTQLSKSGFYTFKVPQLARKANIKKAVESQFNIDVVSIKTIKMHGKSKKVSRLGFQIPAKSWKKAVIKIKKDQKIPLFEAKS